jgi:DNA-binding LacI/PurR family transcriptional regulator
MKYMTIYRDIAGRIESGIYKSGSRLPDTLDLAAQLKVSHSTIFRALQRLSREGLVHRVRSKGTFVNILHRESYLETVRDKRIGMLFRGMNSALLSRHDLGECMSGAEMYFHEKGRKLVMLPLESRNMEEYVREIEAAKLKGAIVHGIPLPALMAALRKMGIPFVCTDYLDYNLAADQVTTDHLKAGSLALGRLLELGHRKVLFFGHYIRPLRRNDPDHEYWWTAISSGARMLRLKNIRPLFLSYLGEAKMKNDIRSFILKHRDWTGYICTTATFCRLLKEILESEPSFKETARDTVLFTDLTAAQYINDRPVAYCRWDSREMGRKAAEILQSILEGGPHKPQIHYIPVEMM